MSTTPIDVVRAFISALENKDFDAALALVSHDCEYDNVPMNKVHGPAGIRSVLEPFLGGCAAVEWVILREAADGPIVFNERIDRFHLAHGWAELPVNGVWEVHQGKITLWRDYFDVLSFQKAFAPPP